MYLSKSVVYYFLIERYLLKQIFSIYIFWLYLLFIQSFSRPGSFRLQDVIFQILNDRMEVLEPDSRFIFVWKNGPCWCYKAFIVKPCCDRKSISGASFVPTTVSTPPRTNCKHRVARCRRIHLQRKSLLPASSDEVLEAGSSIRGMNRTQPGPRDKRRSQLDRI